MSNFQEKSCISFEWAMNILLDEVQSYLPQLYSSERSGQSAVPSHFLYRSTQLPSTHRNSTGEQVRRGDGVITLDDPGKQG